MHELSITQQILDIALRYASEGGATHVSDLYLVVGDLSTVVDDSVQFYWDFVSRDTIAEGAQLHFRRLPAEMACQACEATYTPEKDLACPACGSHQVVVVQGEEFYLEAIEVETAGSAVSTGDQKTSGG